MQQLTEAIHDGLELTAEQLAEFDPRVNLTPSRADVAWRPDRLYPSLDDEGTIMMPPAWEEALDRFFVRWTDRVNNALVWCVTNVRGLRAP